MSKSDRVKKEHYVPRFYLKNFAYDNAKSVYVFDKKSFRSYSQNIEDVASTRFFYDFPTIDEEGFRKYQIVEKNILRVLDNSHSEILKKIINNVQNTGKIENCLKIDFSPFVGLLFTRTKSFRQLMLDCYKQINEHVGGEIEFDKNEEAYEHARFMFQESFKEFSFIISKHIWIFGLNNSLYPLYTSDNPVGLTSHEQLKPWQGLGIAQPGIEMFMPLSPKIILCMYHRSLGDKYIFGKELKEYDCKLMNLDEECIKFYNCGQIDNCENKIISNTNDFIFALDFLKNR